MDINLLIGLSIVAVVLGIVFLDRQPKRRRRDSTSANDGGSGDTPSFAHTHHASRACHDSSDTGSDGGGDSGGGDGGGGGD